MRGLVIGAVMGWLGLGGAALAEQSAVVVELFTSQGCASCPPADALLAELGKRDDVIPLALHVPYWDHIGWKDRFASPENEKRQRGYARAGGWRMIYTPQMVIMGAEHVVGSRADQVDALIAQHAAKPPHVALSLERHDGQVWIRAEAIGEMAPCDVHIVRYDAAHEVMINRGENAGRTITYTHIVQDWDMAARWDGTGVYESAVAAAEGEHIVVILQAPKNGHIMAAARLR